MKKIYLLSGPGTIEGFSNVISKELEKDLKDAKTITFISSSPEKHEKNINFVYGNDKIAGMINHLKEIANFKVVNIVDDKNKNLDINSDVIYGVPNSSCIKVSDGNIEMIGKVYEFNNGNVIEYN